MSLRLRLALMAGVATFAVTALFGSAVYLVTSQRLYTSVDELLDQYAAQVTGRLERAAPFPVSLPRSLGGHPDAFAIAYAADGTEVGRSTNATGLAVSLPADAQRAALQGRSTSWTVQSGGQRYRLRVVPVQGGGAAATVRILATGSSLQGLDSLLANLRLILLAAAPAALALALLLSWVVAGRGLRPVRELTSAAGRLGTEDLSRRLPLGQRRDELAGLTEAFNASLDRLEATYVALEQALARQQQFVADASHELRSPLTVILNDAQTLVDHPEVPSAERAEVLAELVEEARRMSRLAGDLLHLARTSPEGALDVDEVDWDTFLEDAVRDATAMCAPRPVAVDRPERLGSGTADRAALLRAFRVLFDNIARHTPDSAAVEVAAQVDGPWLRFSVSDTGPGVPPEALPHVFDRFYRADRSRQGHGSGLGLAIARATVEAHGGEARASSEPGSGFHVGVRLPRYAALPE
jgi:signal transduction histidine kinase